MTNRRELVARSLVKGILYTKSYPGFEYMFFGSFAEVDEIFRSIHGPAWTLLPWAKVWLYEEDEKLTRKRQPNKIGLKQKIKEIYDYFNYNISMRSVHSQLVQIGFKVSWRTCYKTCKKILEENNKNAR